MDESDRNAVVARIEEIIDMWVEYDNSGDFSAHVDTDTIAEEAVHVHPGEPPIVGKEDFVAFFEELDPSDADWEATIDDVHVGRDLVVTRSTFRSTTVPEDGADPERSITTSVDVFERSEDGELRHLLSVPSSDG